MIYSVTSRKGSNQYYEDVLSEGVLPLRMMLIPSGVFLMGAPEAELERSKFDIPQHSVTVSRFFMGKYPVTQAQWRAVVAMPQVTCSLEAMPSKIRGDMHPVTQVSWYEAVEFCARLTVHSNRQYRLPTEAEWEYACRAVTTTPFHFGNTITTELANYRGTTNDKFDWAGSYNDGPKGEYRKATTPVDKFGSPNAYGLCDLHGNVYEWCQDHWHENYEGAPTDGSAWSNDNEEASRVLRGGSWDENPRHCRSASRDFYSPDDRFSFIGFRVSSASRALP